MVDSSKFWVNLEAEVSNDLLSEFPSFEEVMVMLSFMSPTCLILSYIIPALKGRTMMTKSVAFPMLENLSLILTRKFSIFCRPFLFWLWWSKLIAFREEKSSLVQHCRRFYGCPCTRVATKIHRRYWGRDAGLGPYGAHQINFHAWCMSCHWVT